MRALHFCLWIAAGALFAVTAHFTAWTVSESLGTGLLTGILDDRLPAHDSDRLTRMVASQRTKLTHLREGAWKVRRHVQFLEKQVRHQQQVIAQLRGSAQHPQQPCPPSPTTPPRLPADTATAAPPPATSTPHPPPPTPPPTPAPLPPPEETICASLANTEGLHLMWARKNSSDGNRLPKPDDSTFPTAVCDEGDLKPRIVPVPPGSSNVPLAISQARSWYRNHVTQDDVARLRADGVLEQLYVDHTLKLLFCAVPKAGCTGTKAWLLRNAGLWTSSTAHNRTLFSGERLQMGSLMSDEKLVEVLNGGEYFKFTVIRNPFTRTLATFLERYYSCSPHSTKKRRPQAECLQWRKALHRGDFDESSYLTFSDYLDVLNKQKKVYDKNMNFLNAHWVPAVRVCGFNRFAYDFVAKLEGPRELEMVYNLTGLPGFTGKTGEKLKHSEGTSTKIQRFFTPELLEKAVKYYAEDMKYLGYSTLPITKALENMTSSSSTP